MSTAACRPSPSLLLESEASFHVDRDLRGIVSAIKHVSAQFNNARARLRMLLCCYAEQAEIGHSAAMLIGTVASVVVDNYAMCKQDNSTEQRHTNSVQRASRTSIRALHELHRRCRTDLVSDQVSMSAALAA